MLAFNLIVLGLVTVIILFPFPKRWNQLAKKWFPFLQTWRGRGFYFLLLGSICCSLNLPIPIIVGIVCLLNGLVHIILTFWFRDTLDPTVVHDNVQVDSKNIDSLNLKKEIYDIAYDNREKIAKTAYENRETIGKVARSTVEFVKENPDIVQ